LVKSALALLILISLTFSLDGEARPSKRSSSVRAEFQRTYPCPSTGRSRGACPGYQVDHKVPLKCGGPDNIGNMQWLTVRAHKAKTKREARWCRR
jgi:5-methylcytosine-specific restriction endonuclease McrA